MRQIMLLSSIISLLVACAGQTEPEEIVIPNPLPPNLQSEKREIKDNDLFELDKIPEITITISEEEFNELLSNMDVNMKTEKEVHADFTFKHGWDTETVTNIGFRVRGNSFSRRRPYGSSGDLFDAQVSDWHHAHFRVDFKEFVDGRRFYGMRSLNLKWYNGDPAYVRENYAFDLFHRFGVWTAPRTAYCRLTLQVEGAEPVYYGVYRMNEHVDKEFIQDRWPDSDDGDLWKCLFPAPLRYAGAENHIGIEEPEIEYFPPYDLKTNKKDFESAKLRFLQFLSNVSYLNGDAFQEWVEENLAVDLFLRTMAVSCLLGSFDDYWKNQNNYYMYFDESGKAYFIPYDYDNVLGTCVGYDCGTEDLFEWGPVNASRPLIDKLFDIPMYKSAYAYYISVLIDPEMELFDPESSVLRILNWQKSIERYVDNDTGEDDELEDKPAGWGYCDFYRLTTASEEKIDYEANWFLRRLTYAEKQLGMEPSYPEVFWLDRGALPEKEVMTVLLEADMGESDAVRVSAELSADWSDDKRTIVLNDAGTNGDSVSGDRIYSAVFETNDVSIIYYKFNAYDAEAQPLPANANWLPGNMRLRSVLETNRVEMDYIQ